MSAAAGEGAAYFAVWATDRPGTGAERLRVRDEHRARLRAGAPGLRVHLGGPTEDEQGEMNGSLLVIDFTDRAAALAWLAAEPFTRAGVYGRSEVRAFRNLWPQKAGFAET